MNLCCSFGPSYRIGKPGFDFNTSKADTTLAEYHPKGKRAIVLFPENVLTRIGDAVDRFQFLYRA
jgi:hypothetical protein